jgi:ATP adenylyltransferase
MDRLWSPWRSRYIESFAEETKVSKEAEQCLFCRVLSETDKDEENLIVRRGTTCFIMLNLYPYNSGHLMIVPHTHTGELSGLSRDELTEIMLCSQQCIKALNDALHPQGFNIGMNIGRVSGAGIDGHIHMHMVPRWNGDTNFMPVLSETRIISIAIEETYNKIREGLREK